VETLPPRLPPMARPRRPGRAARLQGDACGTWSARLSPPRARAPSGAPLGRRGGAAGKRAGQPGMGWRGGEPAPPHTTRQRAACPCGAGLTRDFGQPPAGDTAEASRGPPRWGGLPQGGSLACPQGAAGAPPGASAPSADRAGDPGRQMGAGARPATSAAPRVRCQESGGHPGDGTPRHMAPGGGWGPLGDAGAASPGGALPGPTGVASPRVAPGVSPDKHRHPPPREAMEAGPRQAGALPGGPGAARGTPGRVARVWLPPRASAPWRVAGDLRAGCASGAHDWWGAPRPLAKAILRPGRHAGCLAPPLLAPTETGVPPGGGSAPVSMSLARPGVARPRTGAVPPCQGPHRTKVHGSRLAEACLSTGTATGCLAPAVQPRVAPGLAARGLARARADAGHAQGGGG
jgi:hypothetical protein